MDRPFSQRLFLPDAAATDALADRIAPCLSKGDVILLSGAIGAGKSHLARQIIRARLHRFEEIPSPTFTLVQCYDHPDGDIWHCDLYRLSHPDEVIELGLEAAFQSAICLIEWPDRLGYLRPADAISIALDAFGDGRSAQIDFALRPALQHALSGFAP